VVVHQGKSEKISEKQGGDNRGRKKKRQERKHGISTKKETGRVGAKMVGKGVGK